MIPTILDTKTNKTYIGRELSIWDYEEGNWSCDCNRELECRFELNDSRYCIGSKRFLVISVEFSPEEREEYSRLPSLFELNQQYPKELLEKFLNKK